MLFKYFFIFLLPILLFAEEFVEKYVDIEVEEIFPKHKKEKKIDNIIWSNLSNDVLEKDEYNKVIKSYIQNKYPKKVREYKKLYTKKKKVIQQKKLLIDKKRTEREKKLSKLQRIKNYTFTKDTIMWQDNSDTDMKYKNLYDAKIYCEKLNLLSFENWRLATKMELQTMVDKNDLRYSLLQKYWSSTPYISNSTKGWVVDMKNGKDLRSARIEQFSYRCVRDTDGE